MKNDAFQLTHFLGLNVGSVVPNLLAASQSLFIKHYKYQRMCELFNPESPTLHVMTTADRRL